VIAAFGGVVSISEAITLRLLIAALMILGGIFVVVWSKYDYPLKRKSSARDF
jgi:hypothetical protein